MDFEDDTSIIEKDIPLSYNNDPFKSEIGSYMPSRSLRDDLNNSSLFTDNKPGDYTYNETQNSKHAEGSLILSKGDRNPTIQKEAGGSNRQDTDDGGHILATRFSGSSDAVNVDAQNSNLNRGSYKQLENDEANSLQDGNKIFTSKDTYKSNNSERPDAYMGYDIIERPDGTRDWNAYSFQNESAAIKETWNSESKAVFEEMSDEYFNPMYNRKEESLKTEKTSGNQETSSGKRTHADAETPEENESPQQEENSNDKEPYQSEETSEENNPGQNNDCGYDYYIGIGY